MSVIKAVTSFVIAVAVLWVIYNLLVAYGHKIQREQKEKQLKEIEDAKVRYAKIWKDSNDEFHKSNK
jgi:ABC-type phosphate transport system ATPase subunit